MAEEAREEPIDVDLPKSLKATRLGRDRRICALRGPEKRNAARR